MDGAINAKCGFIQPDMEMHMCADCYERWEEAVKRLHQQQQ